MDEKVWQALTYSHISICAFGIIGNILVIVSILGQRKLLKNNYHFLVLHLAICDFGCLVIFFLDKVRIIFDTSHYSILPCVVRRMVYFFGAAGIYMMLVISVLRYFATIYPLKPAISRRKLKIVCGISCFLALVTGYGAVIPFCITELNDTWTVYRTFFAVYVLFWFNLFPTVFMAVVYYKIGRALIKQKKQLKLVCSNAVRSRFIHNRRSFLVCLGTVFCYGVCVVLSSVYEITSIVYEEYFPNWVEYVAIIFRIAGSNSLNPLIYGIFDKKLLTFWKSCQTTKTP